MRTLKHIRYIAVALCGVATLLSCNKEDIIPENTATPIHFTTPDNWGDEPSATRVNTEGNKTVFEPDKDKIGVYADYLPGGNEANKQEFMVNQMVEYVTDDDANLVWQYAPIKYWPTAADDKLSFYAYYPYTENVSDGVATLTINGTNNILWANKVNEKDATTTDNRHTSASGGVNFGMRHLLNRISIKFVQGEDFADGNSVSSVSITNAYSQAELNVKTGEMKEVASSSFADITYSTGAPWSITTTGTGTTEYLCVGKTRNNVLAITAVVDGTASNVEIPYTYNSSDAGKSYIITLRFMPKGIDVTLETDGDVWEDIFNWNEVIR